MLELLRDPLWQFIGAILTIFTVFLGYFLQKSRKSISYEILTSSQLLSINENLAGRLQVLYDGQSVPNIHLIEVRISNTGNTPIPISDYESPIKINTGELSKILSGIIIKSTPSNLTSQFVVEDTSISITPCLLNSSDSLTFKILISNYTENLNVEARIIGVKSVQKFAKLFTKNEKILYASYLIFTTGVLFLQFFSKNFSIFTEDHNIIGNVIVNITLFGFSISLIAVIFNFVGIIYNKINRAN